MSNSSLGYVNGGNVATSNNLFYSRVMGWLFAAFGAAAVGTMLIGPLVPLSMMMPLSLVALGVLIVSGFVRKSPKVSGALAIGIPLILGITLYPVLNYYLSSGAGDIVVSSLIGTAVIFGGMALWGWRSPRSFNRWEGKLFFVVLALIVVSLLNTFFFKMTILGLVISCVVLVVFAIYSFIDIQRIRDYDGSDHSTASMYALNVFLDILNLFTSLLNILGFLSRD